MAVENISYGAYAALVVTNIQSLANDANDPFAGWQSARVSNLVALADDYEVVVSLPTAATAPAGSRSAYLYLVQWISTDGGTTWIAGGDFGTATKPTGSEGLAVISEPNNMRPALTLSYKIASQTMEGIFRLSEIVSAMPDAFSFALRNDTGAALGTGCVISYRPITYTVA